MISRDPSRLSKRTDDTDRLDVTQAVLASMSPRLGTNRQRARQVLADKKFFNSLPPEQRALVRSMAESGRRSAGETLDEVAGATKGESLTALETDESSTLAKLHGIDESNPCRMSMIVYVNGSKTPFVRNAHFATPDKPFDDEFRFSNSNELLVFHHEGRWKIEGQQKEGFDSQQALFNELWDRNRPDPKS